MDWLILHWSRERPETFLARVQEALGHRGHEAFLFQPEGDRFSSGLVGACERLWAREDAIPVFSVIRFGRSPEYIRAPRANGLAWWCDVQADTPTIMVFRQLDLTRLSLTDDTPEAVCRHLLRDGVRGTWVQGALCFQRT